MVSICRYSVVVVFISAILETQSGQTSKENWLPGNLNIYFGFNFYYSCTQGSKLSFSKFIQPGAISSWDTVLYQAFLHTK